jgi:hypothetical protein
MLGKFIAGDFTAITGEMRRLQMKTLVLANFCSLLAFGERWFLSLYTNYTTTLFSSVTCVVILLSLSIFHSEIRRTIISSLSLAITETCSLLTVSSSFVSVTSTYISVSCPLILFSIA